MLTVTSPPLISSTAVRTCSATRLGLGLRAQRQKNGELVAADTRDRVTCADRAADRLPEPDQQRVAGVVALSLISLNSSTSITSSCVVLPRVS